MKPKSLFTPADIAKLSAAKAAAPAVIARGYVLTKSGRRVPVASERRSGPRRKTT